MIEDVRFKIDDEVVVASNQDLSCLHIYHNKVYKVYSVLYTNESDDREKLQSIKIKNDLGEICNCFSFRFTIPIRKMRKAKLENLENING